MRSLPNVMEILSHSLELNAVALNCLLVMIASCHQYSLLACALINLPLRTDQLLILILLLLYKFAYSIDVTYC